MGTPAVVFGFNIVVDLLIRANALIANAIIAAATVTEIAFKSQIVLGAFAGNVLPSSVSGALGIVLYGMFLAIILPPAKTNRPVLIAVLIAAALSIVFKYVLAFVSEGFAIIICAVVAAGFCAFFFPVHDEEKEAEE